jgi:hypothetical protein
MLLGTGKMTTYLDLLACKLMIWDLCTNKPEQSVVAHQKEASMVDSSVADLNVYLSSEIPEVLKFVLSSSFSFEVVLVRGGLERG